MSRTAKVERRTRETDIVVGLELDGTGASDINTPLPFLSHMVEQISRHGLLNLHVRAQGDIEVDGHHTTEDLGIVLGLALKEALGDGSGIRRYGFATLPMDEARASVALDLSGRPYFVWSVPLAHAKLGNWDTELAEVFFEAVARSARMNLHVTLEAGRNLHHCIEICFKAFARALRMAVEVDPRQAGIPSTKGHLD
jgi:imidazoleglycerol-phosphate dehydratase